MANVFTPKATRMLGVKVEMPEEAKQVGLVPIEKTELEKVAEVRKWIFENRKDGTVSASQLANFITNLGLDPQKVVEKLKDEGLLFPVSEPNKWGVA